MRAVLMGALLGIILAATALCQLPKDHPPLPSSGDRAKAERLTVSIAGSTPLGPATPVPRRNLIDEHIFGKMERDGIPHAPLASDAEFFRRVHLDLIGRIGDDAALAAFLASQDPAKHDKLVDSLVGSPAYRARWTYWFGDLAMAAANRVGNEGKNLFYRWLYDNIQIDRPFDEMVTDMLTANAASNWFVGPASYLARWVVIGVTCEDTVHEDTSDELAINAVKHFMGVDLNCVSCHDGANHLEKINTWLAGRKREELYRMGAFFAKSRILRRVEVATTQDEYSIDDKGPGYDMAARTVVRVPRRSKGIAEPVFLFTGEKPDPAKPPRAEFARMLTSHPQFARAAVNLHWAALMGVGIVDPPLDFDLARTQASHPELLDALADSFRKSGHSLQKLHKLIAKSSAYRLSSRFPGEWKESYARYFARKFVRRLTAEQIHDSIVQATGLYTNVPIRGTDFIARYATETRSPEDFKGRYPGLKDINFFLESFGQTNREYAERTNEGDITQAVLLMNSPWVLGQVKAKPGSFLSKLLGDGTPPDSAVDAVFARFLNRRPTARETAMARELTASRGREGYEDLQWLILNKVDFVFNY